MAPLLRVFALKSASGWFGIPGSPPSLPLSLSSIFLLPTSSLLSFSPDLRLAGGLERCDRRGPRVKLGATKVPDTDTWVQEAQCLARWTRLDRLSGSCCNCPGPGLRLGRVSGTILFTDPSPYHVLPTPQHTELGSSCPRIRSQRSSPECLRRNYKREENVPW